jgi:hypothetical protein
VSHLVDILVAPMLSGEGAERNDNESDVLMNDRTRLASRGALGDGALPFNQGNDEGLFR